MLTNIPRDVTDEEIGILKYASIELYTKLEDPVDKFIVAMAFDLGYGREETAEALGVSYVTVYKKIKSIKEKLKKSYKTVKV